MVQFGLQIEPQFGFTFERVRELARFAEGVGFEYLWCSDHLFLDDRSEERNCWDCWTLLTGLALESSNLRIGPMVTCVSYRHPSLLAKIAACVDSMSGGRLEFGIGAGWKHVEYAAYGYPFPSPRERVDRLEEALEVVLRMWSDSRASYEGRYYQVRDAVLAPKPAQQPRPPIWIGGSGQRVLTLAARRADAVNINGMPSVERYRDRMDVLRRACGSVGRDFDSIRKSHFMALAMAEDSAGLDEIFRRMAEDRGRSVDEVRSNYIGVEGTPDEVAGLLQQYMGLGADHFMFMFPYGHEEASMQMMMDSTAPQLG